jgi:hypothetical protein
MRDLIQLSADPWQAPQTKFKDRLDLMDYSELTFLKQLNLFFFLSSNTQKSLNIVSCNVNDLKYDWGEFGAFKFQIKFQIVRLEAPFCAKKCRLHVVMKVVMVTPHSRVHLNLTDQNLQSCVFKENQRVVLGLRPEVFNRWLRQCLPGHTRRKGKAPHRTEVPAKDIPVRSASMPWLITVLGTAGWWSLLDRGGQVCPSKTNSSTCNTVEYTGRAIAVARGKPRGLTQRFVLSWIRTKVIRM